MITCISVFIIKTIQSTRLASTDHIAVTERCAHNLTVGITETL